jgi:Ser/Thr protein kinase RdoA (MazF antagonist)
MSSIRFDKIGSVIKNPDGTYTVGPIPNIGGPFDTAADFFRHWANWLKFPTDETGVRKLMGGRPDLFDAVWSSIEDFPSRLSDLARRYSFQSGPFPISHTDLHRSNVLMDSDHRIQKVVDWDNAFVAP